MGQCILIKPTSNYTHPSTHPATMISQDADHRFTTDTEKSNWNGKAAGNHTHSYLPLAGGTMTGDLKVKVGDFIAIPIKIYPGDVNGAGLVSQAGGLYIAGSGESAQNLYTAMGISAATERTFITSDNDISLVTNCQTIANRKTVTIDTSGRVTAPGGFAGTAPSNHSHDSAYVKVTHRTLTLTVAGWSASYPYTQTINVSGIAANDDIKVIGVYVPANATLAQVKGWNKAAGYLMCNPDGVTAGKITFKAYKKPAIDFQIITEGG